MEQVWSRDIHLGVDGRLIEAIPDTVDAHLVFRSDYDESSGSILNPSNSQTGNT